ncbi:lanthionine synthetase LanC family protein [Chryseobacterium vrystaatense]|uniref:Lanthionine synthetase C-like protein n=1 Tax=Chryseobacterium vrystaatense TaxID=307480 RepID=A0ABR4UJL2_9FLAO|nr:lanthionine synthetase LanC family protein [Chryseobacterium vrystaatense]KFF24929.1 hypothetical protein IW16_18610 [Chryseobacterium vrystaatense]
MKINELELSKIADALEKNISILKEVGLNKGILGASLFYYYYHLYTEKEEFLEMSGDYLNLSLSSINETYDGDSLILDMCEIVHVLYYYKKKAVIDEDVNDYLESYDHWALKFLQTKIEEKNIDSVNGCVRIGYYLFQRMEDKNFEKELKTVINTIDSLAVKEGSSIRWNYNFLWGRPSNELGIMHGIAGTCQFLLYCYKRDFEKEKCLELLTGALHYLISNKTTDDNSTNIFPFDSIQQNYINYSNICYGDLGIAFILYHASQILNNDDYLDLSNETIIHFINKRDVIENELTDASLLYGYSGLYSLMRTFYQYTGKTEYLENADFWHKKILDSNQNETPWAGYSTHFNSDLEELHLSFSQGIIGIGISLITADLQMENEHLFFLKYFLI